ncbi:hypothetical protein [Kitasatospora sp. NPDC094011]|uniref:hypothetical protein n=1 Tax=Kitasatospora sp. NPDC094011 TaxID=3364090 RepID=UPI0037F21E0B
MSKYTVIPIADLAGKTSPCWVVKNNLTDELVKALLPQEAALRFYSYEAALAWCRKNDTVGQEAA